MNERATVTKRNLRPINTLKLLSHREMEGLLASGKEVFKLFRECALAVLNTGNDDDDATALLDLYEDFEIRVVPQSRGIKLEVHNAPESAFVDGQMIRGIQDHLFSALRDIVYVDHRINRGLEFDLNTTSGITDTVFDILRNAGIFRPNVRPDLVVCWGGHSISRHEYDYSKEVGYELGLRSLNIVTGCGIGAMKGPMKGAAVGHAKQQVEERRYIGISEPGIIAAESPNPIVNELVILPDIEKRLEAFVRLSHCIIVFPGGAGTAEEILYILGILMHEMNQPIPFPLIFTAPEESAGYFEVMDQFLVQTLGEQVRDYYKIIIDDPAEVARQARLGVEGVTRHRRKRQEAYGYNWSLHIDESLQKPFEPTHENMAQLTLDTSLPAGELASQLRRAFSGIVAGNVKAYGIRRIREHGPYKLRGEAALMQSLDNLLDQFVEQGRMKLSGKYEPCYEIVS